MEIILTMNYFENIDKSLDSLASKLGGVISFDRTYLIDPIPERRIDWKNGKIKKAIIIQPTFTSTGIDLNLWNFIIVAWKDEFTNRKQFISTLVDKKDIKLIQESIDDLLKESETILEDLSENDLKEFRST